MNKRSFPLAANQWCNPREDETVVSRTLPTKSYTHSLFVRLASLIFVGFILIIVAVELGSRVNPTFAFIDPPSDLLPAKRGFLMDAYCESLHDGRFFCRLNRNGSEIRVTYDAVSQSIVYTLVALSDKTLGDLVLAWGTPIGYARSGQAITVFWTTRAAQLTPASFEPKSRVLYVAYGQVPQELQPWHGFTSQTFPSENH